MFQITLSQEDLNVVIKGLSVLPLGESMNTFQRVIAQVQKQQAPPEQTTNGVDRVIHE